jgi:tRNA-dihydrouridine synthase 1
MGITATPAAAILPQWQQEEQESNQNEVALSQNGIMPLVSNTSLRNLGEGNVIKNSTGIPREWLVELLQKYSATNNCTHDAHDVLRNKALVVAPMVDQSDLPFRVLCRKYGANLCYTPMIHARMFVNNEQGYRNKFWKKVVEANGDHHDRPLVVQFAGGDPSILAKAAKIVQGRCDAIDLNCGCPQSIAKRGNYGAYLLEQEELVLQCIRALRQAVPDTPITVKVRLLPIIPDDSTSNSTIHSSISHSISLYLKFIEAGVSLITVHGRNRFQKGSLMGSADWHAIQQVVQVCGQYVPIIANGSCASLQDVEECLRVTGADGT